MKQTKNLLLIPALFSAAVFANAESTEVFQTGRYSYVKNTPTTQQANPLKVIVNTKIPQSIYTVGDSMRFLLLRSGYRLAKDEALSESATSLMNLPLPDVHRHINSLSLEVALETLAGKAFQLSVDEVTRTVAFELTDKARGI